MPVLPRGLPDAPWNQISAVELQIWPRAVGIAFLLTAETSFSLCFPLVLQVPTDRGQKPIISLFCRFYPYITNGAG